MNKTDLILVNFHWDCGRAGNLCGLFVSTREELENSYGKYVYFGEVLGKHSEIAGEISPEDFEIVTGDQEFLQKLIDYVGSGTISGYNPLAYLEWNEDEEYIEEEGEND